MNKKSWFEYYRHHSHILISNIFLHWFYLLNIIFRRPLNMLEMGCGMADHSVFLSLILKGSTISLMDKDPKIINRLKRKYGCKFSNYYQCDIISKGEIKRFRFTNDHFDLIYSQGLMEHFSDREFSRIIINIMSIAREVIISVPSENYPTIDFGNEILRNKKSLVGILKKVPGIHFKVYRYFPDIGIMTKLVRIKKGGMKLFSALKYLLFGSNHYLIKIAKK